ncbi:MAG: hypothetical protein POELPBGB_03568 [Bacteroidia bacterium]|nr:hypothetical protein [Bacteroidia bacterium]
MLKNSFTTEAQRHGEKIKITLWLCASVVILLLSSCEKEITIDLPESEKKVVVEGVIEQGKHPYVLLTRSSPYFAPIEDFTNNLFVTDATVIVSDGVIIDTMEGGLNFDIYTPNPAFAYTSDVITGEVGKTYYLTVIADGKTLSASTTIPQPIALDSLWFKEDLGAEDDSLGYVWAHLTDPDTMGNQYRWFSQIMGRQPRLLPADGSVFNDKFINGQSFDFAYDPSDDPLEPEDPDALPLFYFAVGDTVVVKFCTIDKKTYNFLNSLENIRFANGNPFASPASVFSNVEGGGLGGWCGYGASYDTIVLTMPQ